MQIDSTVFIINRDITITTLFLNWVSEIRQAESKRGT